MKDAPTPSQRRSLASLVNALVLLAYAAAASACDSSDHDANATTVAMTTVPATVATPPRATATPSRATPAPGTDAAAAFIIETDTGAYAVHDDGVLTQTMRLPPALAHHPYSYDHAYAFSPDGGRVASGCDADGTLVLVRRGASVDICVADDPIDPQGRPVARRGDFVRGDAIGAPMFNADPFYWSPDGARLLFFVAAGEATDVYAADVAAKTATRVVENSGHARMTVPAWSPDGERFAIAPYIDGPGTPSLLVVNAVTGSKVDLMAGLPAGSHASTSVFWSPDGASLAFTAIDASRTEAAIYVVGADGSDGRRIDSAGLAAGFDSPLSWSPDGEWLVASLITGVYPDAGAPILNAYLLRVDGSAQRALGENLLPLSVAWAPDGDRFALWGSDSAGRTRIAVAEISGSGHAEPIDAVLAGRGGLSLYPTVFAWTADESAIFYSIRGCGQGGCTPEPLYAVDVVGGAPREIWAETVQRFIAPASP